MEEIYKKALIKSQNVNFSYFINLAISAQITWTELGNILEDLTPSLEKSRQLNKVFLKEFEVLHSQKNETTIPENFHSNEEVAMSVNDEEISEHDEEYDESLEHDIESTEKLVENEKDEKEQLVNFFSHLDKGVTSEEIIPKVKRHREKKYKCDFCDKLFDGLWKKKRHEKSHANDKKSSQSKNCEFCKKSFRSYRDRERHERIHTGERPFKCDICQKRFSDSGALKGHEPVHTGTKPFECKICGKCFVRNQTLKTHVVTQHERDKEIRFPA